MENSNQRTYNESSKKSLKIAQQIEDVIQDESENVIVW